MHPPPALLGERATLTMPAAREASRSCFSGKRKVEDSPQLLHNLHGQHVRMEAKDLPFLSHPARAESGSSQAEARPGR